MYCYTLVLALLQSELPRGPGIPPTLACLCARQIQITQLYQVSALEAFRPLWSSQSPCYQASKVLFTTWSGTHPGRTPKAGPSQHWPPASAACSQVAALNLLPQLSLHPPCNFRSPVAFQPEMRSLDLASQQLALRGKNRLAPGDRPEHTELPHLQIGTLLPRSLLQLAFSQSAMATSGSSAGIRWSRQETRTLLSILGEAEYIQRLQTVHHNADVYQAVSKRMQQEGFRRTERQCRSKFKVLKALYLKAYVAHATSMGDPPHCPFYDTLDQLLRNQIVTDPDPDNLMEEAAWPKHCDQNLTASDTPGQEGTSILGAKRTQAADHSPALQTVKESDEDCQLRNSDQMQEASDLEDSWDESSGAGCSQGTPSYSSSHHLFRGAVAPCQSSPMTRLGVSGEPSPCTSTGRNTPGVASAPQPPVSSRVPFVSGGNRPLNSEPPPRWARRRRRSVARTIAAELAENRRLARELSKREEEKLDRLIAIGEVASAQQDIANELRRDAVVAVRRLATAVEEATGAFQLGLEKLLQRLISNTKS